MGVEEALWYASVAKAGYLGPISRVVVHRVLATGQHRHPLSGPVGRSGFCLKNPGATSKPFCKPQQKSHYLDRAPPPGVLQTLKQKAVAGLADGKLGVSY